MNPLVSAFEPDYWHVPDEPDWCKEAVDCAKPGAVQTCPVTCSETGKGDAIMLNKESFANSFAKHPMCLCVGNIGHVL